MSDSIFKIHKVHFKQIAKIVEKFGVCWYHGDGNMYTKEKDTNFRKDFSNPGKEESRYRVCFKTGDHIPETVGQMEKLLQASYQKERAVEREKEKSKTSLEFIDMGDEANEDDDPRSGRGQQFLDGEAEAHAARLKDAHQELDEKAKHINSAHEKLDAKQASVDEKMKQLQALEQKIAQDAEALDKKKAEGKGK